MTLYLLRFMLQPRINLATIATRRAPSRLFRFQNGYIGATLSKVQGRRQPGKAASHHDDAHMLVTAKWRRRDPVPRGFGIEAARQPVSFSFDMAGHVYPIAHFDQSACPAVRALLAAGTLDAANGSHKYGAGIEAVQT
jgi:hypothetical protein